MSKPFLVVVFLLVTGVSVHADLLIRQTITTTGQENRTQNMTMAFKGDIMRLDMGDQMGMIMNTKTGDLITILHAQKSLIRMNGQQLDSMKGLIQQSQQDVPGNAPLTATGKTKEISGYQTSEYIQKGATSEIHHWIAKDYPNYQSILAMLTNLQAGKLGELSGKQSINYADLPGLPLQTTIISKGTTTTATIKSVEEKELPVSTFEPPKDYTETKLPDLGAMTR